MKEYLDEQNICSECVENEFLKNAILVENDLQECSFCKSQNPCWNIEKLGEFVHIAFSEHYTRTPDQPIGYERKLKETDPTFDFERSGDPIVESIMDAVGIKEVAAEEVRRIMNEHHTDLFYENEQEYDVDSHYIRQEVSSEQWESDWNRFEHLLMTESRYFHPERFDQLSAIFKDIATMKSVNSEPAIVIVGPSQPISNLYRARVFQKLTDLKKALDHPEKELGPPPSGLAKSGRMNAKGIPVFYGSDNLDCAIAEVRPPVGSIVAIARFRILRPLNLLDLRILSNINEEGSIFDKQYAERLKRAKFLKILCEQITRPILPDDAESDYIPTQVIADFLATYSEPKIDGIIYPSIQMGKDSAAINVVLFPKSSKICRVNTGTINFTMNPIEGENEFLEPDGEELAPIVFGPNNNDDDAEDLGFPTDDLDESLRFNTLELERDEIHTCSINWSKYSGSRSKSIPVSRTFS